MIYGLVVVTSLGATTLLATFNDRLDCIKEQAMIAKGPNSHAQCWPSKSEQELEARVKEINNSISPTRVIAK